MRTTLLTTDLPAARSDELAWRGFVRRFLALLLGALAAIAALNFLVDPQGMYATRLLPPLTWNTRPAKAELLARAQPKPEALLLGSSRLMTIAPNEVERATGLRTFNAAVNAAYTEDYYALLRYAVEQAGVRPKLVLIGVDVESFHDHEPPNEYLLQPNALGAYLERGERQGAAWQRFTNLFSLYQTKLSFVSLYDRLGGKKINAVDFRPDGSLAQDPWARQKAAGNFDLPARIRRTTEEYKPRYQRYTALSRERLDYLADAVRYARARGARVVMFATPAHPQLTAALAEHGYEERARQARAAMLAIAEREGAEFVAAGAPAEFGGSPDNFYDGVHVDEVNAARLIARVLKTDAVQ